MTVALSLLKHLAYRSPHCRLVLLRAGLAEALRQLWRLGLAPPSPASLAAAHGGGGGGGEFGGEGGGWAAAAGGGAYFVASPALHEALGLLTNLLPECEEARAALAGGREGGGGGAGGATLLQSVLSLMFEVRSGLLLCYPGAEVVVCLQRRSGVEAPRGCK